MSSVGTSLLTQTAEGADHFYERFNTLIQNPGLKRLRAAVAYARWDGLGLISKGLEEFLARGGEFQTIYGVANGVTTPDSLLYSLYLQELYRTHTYAGAIEDKYSNATFHPKFLEFKFDKEVIVIVGSANLTGGGLLRNTEVGIEAKAPNGDELQKKVDAIWKIMRAEAKKVTLSLVRELKRNIELGSEQDPGEGRPKPGKPRLVKIAKRSPKPLFARVLGISEPARRSKIFSKLDALTVRPKALYLQVLSGETGGLAGGDTGYQIQLPVATLATFFGVGTNETRQVTFRFPGDEFTVGLTHFENHTHRVRLRPLKDVPRPVIVIFQRRGVDDYSCSIVSPGQYASILRRKCTEQSRKGARRWGLE
jgi:HKD family nuclease